MCETDSRAGGETESPVVARRRRRRWCVGVEIGESEREIGGEGEVAGGLVTGGNWRPWVIVRAEREKGLELELGCS